MHGTNVEIIPINGYNTLADGQVQTDAGWYEIPNAGLHK